MTLPDFSLMLAVVAVASVAGMLNTVVGSGSLFTYPVLLALGIPPIPANIANNAGLAIGNVAGIWGYREYLTGYWAKIAPHIIATFLGAIAGALLLLRLPVGVFKIVASVLVILGCILVLLQPRLSKMTDLKNNDTPQRRAFTRPSTVAVTALTGLYGGYFGAAQGVVIVGSLGALTSESLQRINAIKNVLQTTAGWTATAVFVLITTIPWEIMLLIASGSLIGARFGAYVGKRIPAFWLRISIVSVGVFSLPLLL